MARYEHLLIFQKSFDLLVRVFQEVHNFPKEYKYSLGSRVQNECLELLDSIITANSEINKEPYLKKVSQQIDRIQIYIRLCYSLKVIGKKKYEVLSKYLIEIGKMAGGWLAGIE